jgi:hypothetical protein
MIQVRHAIDSHCLSVDDDLAAQAFSDYLLVCGAVLFASNNKIDCSYEFANAFPGDHYRLLAGLLNQTKPRCVVDIGTWLGVGTRVMCDYAPYAEIHTFDLQAWDKFPTSWLKTKDFKENGGRVTRYLEDLSRDSVFEKHKNLLNKADFIMCDAPKDGYFEHKFYTLLSNLKMDVKPRWLFLDDIRFPSEEKSWRMIKNPKIDLTSFGHFSGTGLVDISKGLDF